MFAAMSSTRETVRQLPSSHRTVAPSYHRPIFIYEGYIEIYIDLYTDGIMIYTVHTVAACGGPNMQICKSANIRILLRCGQRWLECTFLYIDGWNGTTHCTQRQYYRYYITRMQIQPESVYPPHSPFIFFLDSIPMILRSS